jgi:hypothetical protein
MIDIDKILRDKLDEEQDFPRREQNWSRLAERLPQQTPTKVRPFYWSWYAVAAAVLLLLSTSALAWNVWKTQSENTRLQQHIAQLESKKNEVTSREETTRIIEKTDTVYVYLNEKTNERIAISNNNIAAVQSAAKNKTSIQSIEKQVNKVVTKNNTNKEIETDSRSTKNIIEPALIEKNKLPLNANVQYSPQPNLTNGNAVADNTTPNNTPAIGNANNTATPDAPSIQLNKTILAQLPILATQPLVYVPTEWQKDNDRDDLREAIAQGRLNPNRAIVVKHRPVLGQFMPEIAVGGLAFTTFPTNTVTPYKGIIGGGAALEVGITNSIRLYSTAEWGGTDYVIDIRDDDRGKPRPQKENLPPPPPPSNNDKELQRIEGRRNLAQFSLNLKYRLLNTGRLMPTLQIGHTWRQQAAQPVTYEYRDRRNGQTETLFRNGEAQNFTDLWQAGIGVEKSFGHLNLNLNLDYQKDFAQKTFDYWVLRAGVSYRF